MSTTLFNHDGSRDGEFAEPEDNDPTIGSLYAVSTQQGWPMPKIPKPAPGERALFFGVPVVSLGAVALLLFYLMHGQGGPSGGNSFQHQAHSGVPPIVLSPTASPAPTRQPSPTTEPSPTSTPTQPAQPSPTSQPTPSVAPGPQYETTNQPVTLPNDQQVGPGTALDVQCKTGTDASEQYYLVGGGEVSSAYFVKRDDPELAGC